MARRIFPDSGDRLTYLTLDDRIAPVPAETVVTVFTDPAGTIAANCLHMNGDAVTGPNPLKVDAYTRLPLFQGPNDSTDTLYARVAGGVPTAIYARADDRIDALDTAVTDATTRMATYGVVVPWAAGDMRTTIQAALTAIDGAGGGTVRLGTGDYQVSGSLDVPSNVALVGNSRDGTIITCTASDTPIITMASGYNSLVDLKIRYQTTQTTSNTASIAVRLHNAFSARLERLVILNAYRGIGLLTGGTSTYLASCSFRDIEVLGWSGHAIHLSAVTNTSTGSRFDNLYLHNNPSGTGAQGQGGIFCANMSDSTWATINVEHSKLTDPAFALSSCENLTVDGLHLEGIEPTADFVGFVGLFGGSTSVVFHQMVSTFSFVLDANVATSSPIFKIDNAVRLQVYGLKQRSWTTETRAIPLVYGTSDLSTAQIWMRDVVASAITTVLAGSTSNPFIEYNDRRPTMKFGALTGNAGTLSVGGSDQAQYTPPGGSATDVLVAPGLSSSSPAALGTAAAGSATAPARGDHVHPTTGVLLTSALSSSTPAATASTGAAGSSSNVSKADHVHPTGGTDWAAFTPSLGNVTVGNGTSAGRWRLIDSKTLVFRTIFTLGSTSAITGNVSVGLPSGLTAETGTLQRAGCRVYDSSATAAYAGWGTVNSNNVATLIVTTGGTDVNATTPVTFATGDTISVWGTLELV